MGYVTLRVDMDDVRALREAIETVQGSGIESRYDGIFDALHNLLVDVCSDEDQEQKELDEKQALEDLALIERLEERERQWLKDIKWSASPRLVRTALGGKL